MQYLKLIQSIALMSFLEGTAGSWSLGGTQKMMLVVLRALMPVSPPDLPLSIADDLCMSYMISKRKALLWLTLVPRHKAAAFSSKDLHFYD